MLTLCITSYYHENLIISLSRLRNYFDYPFKLIIHNDNPEYNLTSEYVQNILHRSDVPLFIHNSPKNLGCFNARMNIIKLMRDNIEFKSRWFIFIDNDDVLLTPKLTDEYAPVLNHNALVVTRLREVLSLIDNPNYTPARKSEFIKLENPKAGCVGIPYDTETYLEFFEKSQGFFPTLYKIYGTEKVMEPDDCILMYMFRIFLENKLKMTFAEIAEYIDKFAQSEYSYALTFLENRRGRYEISNGVSDLRYGDNLTGISYESLYYAISTAFYKYLNG